MLHQVVKKHKHFLFCAKYILKVIYIFLLKNCFKQNSGNKFFWSFWKQSFIMFYKQSYDVFKNLADTLCAYQYAILCLFSSSY